jgi:hypothetical protein
MTSVYPRAAVGATGSGRGEHDDGGAPRSILGLMTARRPRRADRGLRSDPGGVDDVDRALERTIDALLDQRRAGATICPSEAARAVEPDGWRELMPAARAAAGRLAARGDVEVTQRGEVVDVATARGPVRIRRPR